MKTGQLFYFKHWNEVYELVGDKPELVPEGKYNLKLVRKGNMASAYLGMNYFPYVATCKNIKSVLNEGSATLITDTDGIPKT